ncbi:Thymidylate kinase [uncultured archaeon]|nr:Thymidylate kinase [uncultured archaeon]
MKPRLIVVEGADGVGKTFLCKKLAKQNNWFYIKTPPTCLLKTKCKNPREELFRYLEGLMLNAIVIRKRLNRGETVICDRYYLTLLVDLSLLRIKLDTSALENFLPKPNKIILLEEDYETVALRLKRKKKKSKLENKIIKDKQTYVNVVKLFTKKNKDYAKSLA